jgi:transposase
MTTATTRPPAATILAIDLGRYRSVACVYDTATAATRFVTVDTTRADLGRLFDRHPAALVVVEAGLSVGWVHDLAGARGLPVRVANTAAEAWKFKHTKRKTDRDDALRLAELAALGRLPTVAVPDPATRQRRALIAHRRALVGRRVAAQNRIRAVLAGRGLPVPRGHRAWTATGLAGLERQARPLAACGPAELWRGLLHLAVADYRHLLGLIADCEAALDRLAAADPATALLQTAPGVGPRTAEVVAAYLHDPRRFASGKQVGAYAGLAPRQYQSGESDRIGRISRRGPALLRALLVEAAWAAVRHNPWARAAYARLTRGGASRRKPAIVALARKLLVRLWAMLRDGRAWRPDPAPA